MSKNPINIFIVDDHKLVIDGITSMLMDTPHIKVVGWACSGEEAINMIDELRPDVVLMDVMLKKMTGLEACRWIKERQPTVNIAILSMEVKKEFLSAGIQCGIHGYLHKDIDKPTLVAAIETIASGHQYFTDALTQLVFQDFYNNERNKVATAKRKLPNELSAREYEVLTLIGSGKRIQEVAEKLFISTKTVATHKAHILDKLRLKNTGELIRYAVKNDIVSI